MKKEDELYSESLEKHFYQLQKKFGFNDDLFIPERHGIKQNLNRYQKPNALPVYNTARSCKDKENRIVLARYHPKTIATGLPSVETLNINQHHRYYLDRILPYVHPIPNIYYIMIRSESLEDILLSQDIQYWSIFPAKATIVNFLFAVSLFFCSRNFFEISELFNVT